MTELLGAVSARLRALTGEACEVDAFSWSMHSDDAALIGGYRRAGYIRSLRLIFDRSFPRRHPEWVDLLEEMMGGDLYGSNVHAKVTLLRAGKLRVVITGSMNYNINRRFEHFEVQDDAEYWGFWRGIVDDVCAKTPRGLRAVEGLQYHESFKAALGGGLAPEGRPPVDLEGGEDDVASALAALEGGEFESAHDLETQLELLEAAGDL
jgi:hypothetical protein